MRAFRSEFLIFFFISQTLHYSAKSGLAHFCSIKSLKSTDVYKTCISLIFSGFRCGLFWNRLTYLANVQKCVH